jgi:hypothetical protein
VNEHLISTQSTRTSIVVRAVEVWLLISVAEVVHGIARITLLQPLVGDFPARQIAVFTGSILVTTIAFIFRRWIGAWESRECLLVGAIWVALTVSFEFFLGRFVLDLSWERIFSDYNIVRGGLLPIGLVLMFFAPLFASRLSRS